MEQDENTKAMIKIYENIMNAAKKNEFGLFFDGLEVKLESKT